MKRVNLRRPHVTHVDEAAVGREAKEAVDNRIRPTIEDTKVAVECLMVLPMDAGVQQQPHVLRHGVGWSRWGWGEIE